MVNRRTGHCFPSTDGKRKCPVCSTYHSNLVAEAIDDSRPDTLITLTQLPIDCRGGIHTTWRNILKRADRAGHPAGAFAWLFTVERDAGGNSCHLHVLLRGQRPPDSFWSSAAYQLCGPRVDIRHLRSPMGSYLLKNCRPSKATCFDCAKVHLAEHIDLNDGRPVHQSRGFFLGDDGSPIGGLRAATSRVREKRRQSDPGDWGICRLPEQEPAPQSCPTWSTRH